MRRCFGWIVLAGVVSLGIGGCKSAADRAAARPTVSTPLELDPTESHEFAGWWSNGSQMMRLDRNSAFVFYKDTNRQHPPHQRGRWSKQNYATLWLEPYTELHEERTRVNVVKIEGRIALRIGTLAPMFAMAEEPPTP